MWVFEANDPWTVILDSRGRLPESTSDFVLFSESARRVLVTEPTWLAGRGRQPPPASWWWGPTSGSGRRSGAGTSGSSGSGRTSTTTSTSLSSSSQWSPRRLSYTWNSGMKDWWLLNLIILQMTNNILDFTNNWGRGRKGCPIFTTSGLVANTTHSWWSCSDPA